MNELSFFSHSLGSATFAPIVVSTGRVAPFSKNDYHAAIGALGRVILRWVREHLEVEFVGAVIDIYFGFERVSALWTVLPVTLVPLIEMIAAKREPSMISTTTILSVGEHHVLMLVIADPITAAFGLGQVLRFAAEAAASNRLRARLLRGPRFSNLAGFLLWHSVSPLLCGWGIMR